MMISSSNIRNDVVIERGLTFFECVSRSLSTRAVPISGRNIHERLLLYWAALFFVEGDQFETLEQLICAIKTDNTHNLRLKQSVIFNSAVKQWVRRIHCVESFLSKDVEVWVLQYPKLLKGLALRFIYYHRKTHRLFCQNVFAQLTAECFGCRVVLVDEFVATKRRCFYPLEAGEYFIDEAPLRTILIQHDIANRSFNWIRGGGDDEIVLEFDLRLGMEEQQQHSFMLRKSWATETGGHRNVSQGMFRNVGDSVFYIAYTPDAATLETDIYQIYPGDENKTFYSLQETDLMLIFCIVDTAKAILCGSHRDYDQYAYFHAIPRTEAVVVVVCHSMNDAHEQLTKNTEFKF